MQLYLIHGVAFTLSIHERIYFNIECKKYLTESVYNVIIGINQFGLLNFNEEETIWKVF